MSDDSDDYTNGTSEGDEARAKQVGAAQRQATNKALGSSAKQADARERGPSAYASRQEEKAKAKQPAPSQRQAKNKALGSSARQADARERGLSSYESREEEKAKAKQRVAFQRQAENKASGSSAREADAGERVSSAKKQRVNAAEQIAAAPRESRAKTSHATKQQTQGDGLGRQAKQPDGKKREARTRRLHVRERGSEKRAATSDAESDEEPRPVKETQLFLVEEMTMVVRLFAEGWFSLWDYNLLYKAAQETTVHTDRQELLVIERFKTALLREGGKPDGMWNTKLKDFLSQLRQLRDEVEDEWTPLSERQTTECLQLFARTFVFSDEQLAMNASRQQSIFDWVIRQEVGCTHRLRAICMMGMKLFGKRDLNAKAMMEVFLDYICDVEQIAQSYREQAEAAEARERARGFRGRLGQPERRVLQPTPKWFAKNRRRRHYASGPEQESQDDVRDDDTARGSVGPTTPPIPEDTEEEVKKKERRRTRFGDMVVQL